MAEEREPPSKKRGVEPSRAVNAVGQTRAGVRRHAPSTDHILLDRVPASVLGAVLGWLTPREVAVLLHDLRFDPPKGTTHEAPLQVVAPGVVTLDHEARGLLPPGTDGKAWRAVLAPFKTGTRHLVLTDLADRLDANRVTLPPLRELLPVIERLEINMGLVRDVAIADVYSFFLLDYLLPSAERLRGFFYRGPDISTYWLGRDVEAVDVDRLLRWMDEHKYVGPLAAFGFCPTAGASATDVTRLGKRLAQVAPRLTELELLLAPSVAATLESTSHLFDHLLALRIELRGPGSREDAECLFARLLKAGRAPHLRELQLRTWSNLNLDPARGVFAGLSSCTSLSTLCIAGTSWSSSDAKLLTPLTQLRHVHVSPRLWPDRPWPLLETLVVPAFDYSETARFLAFARQSTTLRHLDVESLAIVTVQELKDITPLPWVALRVLFQKEFAASKLYPALADCLRAQSRLEVCEVRRNLYGHSGPTMPDEGGLLDALAAGAPRLRELHLRAIDLKWDAASMASFATGCRHVEQIRLQESSVAVMRISSAGLSSWIRNLPRLCDLGLDISIPAGESIDDIRLALTRAHERGRLLRSAAEIGQGAMTEAIQPSARWARSDFSARWLPSAFPH